jgi:hypothetical protein
LQIDRRNAGHLQNHHEQIVSRLLEFFAASVILNQRLHLDEKQTVDGCLSEKKGLAN